MYKVLRKILYESVYGAFEFGIINYAVRYNVDRRENRRVIAVEYLAYIDDCHLRDFSYNVNGDVARV